MGVGYAISINQIKNFLGMLRSGRLVDHATLGATVATDESGKVLISNILSDCDAYRRGLRYGDEVISFAGRPIETTNDFKNILGTLPKDWRVPIVIRRDGQEQTQLVRLVGLHTEGQLARLVAGESPEPPKPKSYKPDKPQDKEPSHDEGEKLDRAAQQAADNADDEGDVPGRPNFKLVKSMLETRPGFANYYFNRLERQQVWSRLQKLGDFSKTQPTWKLTGKLATEPTPTEIGLASDKASLAIGRKSVELSLSDAMAVVADKNQEEGILIAMRAWQQLLQEGPDKIGSTIYLGTAPIYPTLDRSLAGMQICDCLQTTWYDAMVRFYVPVGSSEVSCIEVFGESGNDPVELYLDQYREVNGLMWPGRARLQYGTEPLFVVAIEKIETL